MLYLIDSADVEFVKEMLGVYNVVGVTTNPTIIARENKTQTSVVTELKQILNGKDLHVQLTKEIFHDMILEASDLIESFGKDLNIKIPVSKDGFKAIKYLSAKGYNVTATAVCNINQGVMASLLGAKYIAVYVNRISNSGIDGNSVVKGIKDIYDELNLKTKIIGASYKSVHQINESIRNGADQVTVGKDLFEKLFQSDITDQSIIQFTKDCNNI